MSGGDKAFWFFIAVLILAALAGGTESGTGTGTDHKPVDNVPCTETFRGGC